MKVVKEIQTIKDVVGVIWPDLQKFTSKKFSIEDSLLLKRKHLISNGHWTPDDEAYFLVILHLDEDLKDVCREQYMSIANVVGEYRGNRVPLGLEFEGQYNVQSLIEWVKKNK